ncbi:UNKNOWN [Stylonychia lemnae]|uniref:Uncharacterized protein n=1 Tax=Stylonychia lemnae TaxID=5949 RepID=A0A078AWY4_STYLE|nr:UNKNOWN [Stylonychia lemnae]|eukprot:CDW86945.1 UNKNOWN [Stylonychia lemnae]
MTDNPHSIEDEALAIVHFMHLSSYQGSHSQQSLLLMQTNTSISENLIYELAFQNPDDFEMILANMHQSILIQFLTKLQNRSHFQDCKIYSDFHTLFDMIIVAQMYIYKGKFDHNHCLYRNCKYDYLESKNKPSWQVQHWIYQFELIYSIKQLLQPKITSLHSK